MLPSVTARAQPAALDAAVEMHARADKHTVLVFFNRYQILVQLLRSQVSPSERGDENITMGRTCMTMAA